MKKIIDDSPSLTVGVSEVPTAAFVGMTLPNSLDRCFAVQTGISRFRWVSGNTQDTINRHFVSDEDVARFFSVGDHSLKELVREALSKGYQCYLFDSMKELMDWACQTEETEK